MKKVLRNDKIRNIAIIAHVDHGKTSLVDSLFKYSGFFREDQQVDDRIMDSMELERERGITIAAKNCSVYYKGVKINIIDTPGHADFGGEVERALSMVDGAILLVDASEGPLPQTRFVLSKAFHAGLKIIVAINKIDRKDARPAEVLDEIYELFFDLDANDEQIEFPVLYTIGREGVVKRSLEDENGDMSILLDAILEEFPGPSYIENEPFQMLVSDLGYSDYLGRLAIGKVFNGSVKQNDTLVCINGNGENIPLKVSKIQSYVGLNLKEAEVSEEGDIIVISGIDNVMIGDTICKKDFPKPLKRITVDEPTVSMKFMANTSPFAGREGRFVQSSKIKERLYKEAMRNVSIKVEETEDADDLIVKGRGEFQLAIILETMRREGYELCVGRPEVIMKKKGDQLLEPIEHLYVDCDEPFLGIVTEKISLRKGKMINLINKGSGRIRAEFTIPSRGLIGYRDEFLSDTKGTGLISSYLKGYEEYRGDFPVRYSGSLVSDRQGKAVAYALFHLEPRGRLFVVPGDDVYEGMIIGEYNKMGDLDVNPCKEKKLTNMRAAGKDENIILRPVLPLTLEQAINFIAEDELAEITPKNIRLRKEILSAQDRHNRKKEK
ncbi:translational GTPase TypA [Calditerrivibrio nitroreducens]|uniref:Large ribosomal subunit assembly factor BipA n=1 Tax=Calditerrivibrio nitroreducens (strain DSM 19672 / NBRC 101217 / Yu37-1) TaxID=768670 RepID=E4TJ45_CALNY|nr:translational GTPase TypA [Calditerrivibrio nitroreducens]ADR18081.1 GTP-binding protein TypA [Calditerrivibrio nitroreducens DSM 19672]